MARQSIGIGAADNDNTGDPLRTALSKANNNFIELYGTDAGVLAGTELLFDVKHKRYTKTISANQQFTLAAAGNLPDCFITIMTTGNGVSILTFPAAWIMRGDAFDPSKKQEIVFKYNGQYVMGCIITLADI